MMPRPVLIVCREYRGRVLLVSPTDSDVHALLNRAGVRWAWHRDGPTVRPSAVSDAVAVAEAEGWTVRDSRARQRASQA